MATQRQIEANRLNALKSTGPRTTEGKAASCLNALKSGLDSESKFVTGEERADFQKLQTEYFEMLRPRTPFERFQVDRLIRSEWLLRRMMRVESHLWEYYCQRVCHSEGVPLGESFAKDSPTFMRLHRRNAALEKSYADAWSELERTRQADDSADTSVADEAPAAGPVPVEPPPAQPKPAAPASEAHRRLSQPLASTAETPKLGSFLNPPAKPSFPILGTRDINGRDAKRSPRLTP